MTLPEPTDDELHELTAALELRRILNVIKDVAALAKPEGRTSAYWSAWELACEEIFFRATDGQWHMDEDEQRFAKNLSSPQAQ